MMLGHCYTEAKVGSCGMVKVLFPLFFLILFLIGPMAPQTFASKNGKGVDNNPTKNISNKIEEYKKRLERLFEPVKYRYVAAGKPDPFKPFLRTEMKNSPPRKSNVVAKKTEHCETPLECMDVGQLTLVGIVLEPNGNAIAMAQDASGIGYILRVGTKIGFNKGKVVSILRDRVIVKEEVKDLRGKLTFRDRILYLHPEEGDEAS